MIYDRLSESSLQKYGDITEHHLSQFASEGLRTLCCAVVEIDEKTYQEWNKKYLIASKKSITIYCIYRYNEALTMNVGPNGMSREEYIDEMKSKIESNLNLLGSTAIEDKLQDEVPETIDTLLRAGIHIWVLTGDKKETAINIGHSCKLLQSGMTHLIIEDDSLDNTRDSLHETQDKMKLAHNDLALIIDGLFLL